ncbi:MAG: ABC transporter permease [Marmoricola sp.]
MNAFPLLLRAEWIKVRSLRSTYLMIALAVLVGLGVGLLYLTSTADAWATTLTARDRAAFDPVADAFSGFQFAELVLAALGVLIATSEYTTGTISATLTAAPRRLRVFAAKLAVLTTVALPICLACSFAAVLLGQQALHAVPDTAVHVGLGNAHVLRGIIGAGLYMTAVTLVGFGIGALLRHTPAALTLMFSLVFLAWPAARALEGFSYLPDRWLLVNAADALVATHATTGPNVPRTPSYAMAWVEIMIYVLVFVGLGAWRSSRDVPG